PAANLQGCLLPCRKRPPRKEHCRDRRLLHCLRSEVLRDDAYLYEFLGSSRDGFAGFRELAHRLFSPNLIKNKVLTAFLRLRSLTLVILYPFATSPPEVS